MYVAGFVVRILWEFNDWKASYFYLQEMPILQMRRKEV